MSCCERSRILHVSTGRPYDVEALPGLLHARGHDALKARLQALVAERAVIVSDTNVAPLYARAAADALGPKCAGIHVIPAGEASKTPAELVRALEAFAALGLTRSSAVIALGGGVIGDLAGLAAALWMRGIDCVQIPTSLLAMVDSSVGGKTAVDLPAGKNLMGVFSQPKAVLIDPQALDTLPERERACGWGEMIKYAGIDARMNQLVHEALAGIEPGSPAPLPTVDLILAAIDVKRRIVEADEREAGERRLLNIGHTVGHAVEAAAHWELSHGASVAIGMAILTRALVREGRLPDEMRVDLEMLLSKTGLPSAVPAALRARSDLDFSPESLLKLCQHDKKAGAADVALVLPVSPGCARIERTSWAKLLERIRAGL